MHTDEGDLPVCDIDKNLSTEALGPVKTWQESEHIALAHNGEAVFPPDIKEQLPCTVIKKIILTSSLEEYKLKAHLRFTYH